MALGDPINVDVTVSGENNTIVSFQGGETNVTNYSGGNSVVSTINENTSNLSVNSGYNVDVSFSENTTSVQNSAHVIGSIPFDCSNLNNCNLFESGDVSGLGTIFVSGSGNYLLVSGASSSASIEVKNEGASLTSAVSSIDFVGDGINATNTGPVVTITVNTGSLYPAINPSGFITGSGHLVGKGETGIFYPASNPQGFITEQSQTGDLVDRNNNQSITGIKSFEDNILPTVSGATKIGLENLPFGSGYFKSIFVDENSINIGNVKLSASAGSLFAGNDKLAFQLFTGVSGIKQYELNGYTYFSGDDNHFVLQSETGLFYANTNPDGFITSTGHLLGKEETGLYKTETGHLVGKGESGIFYANTNPSGFINQSGHLVGKGETGNFITEQIATGHLVGKGESGIFYANTNPSGFINESGHLVGKGETGVYVGKGESGIFYANSNPSGFITGLETGHLVGKGESGVFYANTNPSGFINQSGHLVGKGETGVYVGKGESGIFYANTNPSGFINESGHLVGKGETGVYVGKGESGIFYANTNPSGFINESGHLVGKGETGVYVGKGESGIFYANTNPSGFINQSGHLVGKGETGVYVGKGESGIFYANTNPSGFINQSGHLVGKGETGVYVGKGESGIFYANSNPSGFINESGHLVGKGETGVFYANTNPSGYITGVETGHLVGIQNSGIFQSAINFYGYPKTNPSGFINTSGHLVGKGESGIFYANTNPSGFITEQASTGHLVGKGESGNFYPTSNPSGFVNASNFTGVTGASNIGTGSGIYSGKAGTDLKFTTLIAGPNITFSGDDQHLMISGTTAGGETGHLVGKGESGVLFYANTNPSGYITGIETGHLVGKGETGIYVGKGESGIFYANTNPSGFINESGHLVGKGETGVYVGKGESGIFYANSNPSGFINESGHLVGKGETGVYVGKGESGIFYTNTNPSGYITGVDTGHLVGKEETGIYITETGHLVGKGESGIFYANTNPSGFITGLETGHLVGKGESGIFYTNTNPSGYITGVDTGHLVGKSESGVFYANTNPSGFINESGHLVGKGETGNFITEHASTGHLVGKGESGNFYPASNPSGFLNLSSYTGVTGASNIGLGSGIYSGSINNELKFKSLSGLGNVTVTGNNENIYVSGTTCIQAIGVGESIISGLAAGTTTTTSQGSTSTVFLLRSDNADGDTNFVDVGGNSLLPVGGTIGGNVHHDTSTSNCGASAIYFDGAGDFINISNNDEFDFGNGEFTIEMYVKPSDGRVAGLFSAVYASGGSYGWGIVTRGSANGLNAGDDSNCRMYWYSYGNGTTNYYQPAAYSGPIIPANTWSHVAVTRDASNVLRLFINGTLRSSMTNNQNMTDDNPPGVRLGAFYSNINNYYFKGWMDDIRVSNIALYTANFTPPTCSSIAASVSSSTTTATAGSSKNLECVQIKSLSGIAPISISGDSEHVYLSAFTGAPPTSTTACTKGQIAYDSDYCYFCVDTNQWKRTSLSTW